MGIVMKEMARRGTRRGRRFIPAAILLLAFAHAVGAQQIDSAKADVSPLARAMTLYSQGAFAEAFSLLSDNAVGAEEQTKTEIADRLVMIGLSEYFSKSYKNAYESFRAAVTISPTNSMAIRYFVRMRKAMDVTTLHNAEGTPGIAEGPPVTRPEGQGVEGPPDALLSQGAPPSSTVVAPELKSLLLQIRTEQKKLSAQVLNGKDERDRRQILSLLDEIVQRQNEAAKDASGVLQRQEIVSLLTKLDERIERMNESPAFSTPLIIGAALGSLILAFVVLLLVRARLGRAGYRGTPQVLHAEGVTRSSGKLAGTTYRLEARGGVRAITASGHARGHIPASTLGRIVEELRSALCGTDRSVATAKLSRAIAKELGLSAEAQKNVFAAALAHDAGYLMLDSRELKRIICDGAKTEVEVEFLKSHVEKGPGYFGAIELPDSLRDALLYHHEREDGSGYPKGLSSAAIPRVAKIIGASEAFVTLLGDQGAGKRLTMAEAAAAITDGAGVTFDPLIVAALTRIVDRVHSAATPA